MVCRIQCCRKKRRLFYNRKWEKGEKMLRKLMLDCMLVSLLVFSKEIIEETAKTLFSRASTALHCHSWCQMWYIVCRLTARLTFEFWSENLVRWLSQWADAFAKFSLWIGVRIIFLRVFSSAKWLRQPVNIKTDVLYKVRRQYWKAHAKSSRNPCSIKFSSQYPVRYNFLHSFLPFFLFLLS